MPLLTKLMLPMVVSPVPTLLRNVPVLLNVGVTPPLLASVSLLRESHRPLLLMTAPLWEKSVSAFQFTVP